MKNKFLKISVLSLLAVGTAASLSSCRDAIDIIQPGEVNSDNFFTSIENIEGALNDVYSNTDNYTPIETTALITDEFKINRFRDNDLFNLVVNSNNYYASKIWTDSYRVILNANRFLEGAAKYTPANHELVRYNKAIAHAKVLRAFSYTQLLTYFSQDLSNDNGLGVIISTVTHLNADLQLPRSTNKQVEEVIIKDLDEAYAHLDTSNRYYVSKTMVDALKARLYLYRGNFPQAKVYAEKVLTQSGLSLSQAGTFSAAEVQTDAWKKAFYAENSNSPYRRVWSDAEQGEVIFALSRPARGIGSAIGQIFTANGSNIAGSVRWFVGTNLSKILSETQGDIRRYVYVDPTSNFKPDGSIADGVVDKYPGKGISPTRNDIKIFRLSEIYFILAECATHSGDLVKAREYIQQVREARNYLGLATTPNYATQQEAWADILKERRVELAFEGHRYIDLKRITAKAGVTMDRVPLDFGVNGFVTLPNGDHRYTLPIPLSEIAGNGNIVQNANY